MRVLYFIEHIEREIYLYRSFCKELKKLGDHDVQLVLLNYAMPYNVMNCLFNIVVTPSENKYVNRLASISDIPVVNLNFEQMLSKLNTDLKRPSKSICKNLINVSWSLNFSEYLLESGAIKTSLLQTSRPQTLMLQERHSQFDKSKFSDVLSRARSRVIIYAPLTCLQAFKSNSELKKIAKSKKVKMAHLAERKEWVKGELIEFYKSIIKATDMFFIVRPHPSVSPEQHKSLITSEFGLIPENLIISDEGNVYDYFFISRAVVSNYSSVLLEAQVINLPCYIFENSRMPSMLRYNWMESFQKIKNFSGLNDIAICNSGVPISLNIADSPGFRIAAKVNSYSNLEGVKLNLGFFVRSFLCRRGLGDIKRSMLKYFGIIPNKHLKDVRDFDAL